MLLCPMIDCTEYSELYLRKLKGILIWKLWLLEHVGGFFPHKILLLFGSIWECPTTFMWWGCAINCNEHIICLCSSKERAHSNNIATKLFVQKAWNRKLPTLPNCVSSLSCFFHWGGYVEISWKRLSLDEGYLCSYIFLWRKEEEKTRILWNDSTS